jgi:peroxiredoxin
MRTAKLSFFGLLISLGFAFPKAGFAQSQDSLQVLVFFSETCPICQSVTGELRAVYQEFSSKGVTFTGVFPNENSSNVKTMTKFKEKYKLPFDLVLDEGRKLTKAWKATRTPEVFLIRKSNQTLLYHGKVDNSFESIGRRRTVVTEHYLKNALQDVLQGKIPNPAENQAVGCFLTTYDNP